MIPFLKEEIERLEPCRHKVLHLQTVQKDLKQHYEELTVIVNQTKKECILDEIEMEEEKDELMLAKFVVMEQVRQKQQELQMALLEKNRIMKQCELNEEKLLKYREESNQLQAKSQKICAQKTKMLREIRENEVICERVCMQNKQLRERCEEQIKRVSQYTVERQDTKMESVIRKTIEENIQMTESIIRMSEPLQEKTTKLNSLDSCEDKKKIASLKTELQLQNRENFLMKSQLKCEQIKFMELSARVQAKETAKSIRDSLCATSEGDQQNLWIQIQRQRQKQDQLQAKLSQCRKIKQQLQQMHEKLSQHYSACTSSDLRGIRQMGKASSRFQRNIHQQKHFLLERYSIVDSYRKYLKNT